MTMPLLVALLLLLAELPAAAQAPAPAPNAVMAAVMACRGPTSVYLLAQERGFKRGDWVLIGDRRDDDEPPLAAALSAFYESTHCVFDLDPAPALQLVGPARSDRLAVYHLKVRYLGAERIAASRVCKGDHDQWVWVERAELLAALKAVEPAPTLRTVDGEAKSVTLDAASAAALRQAVIDKLIPGTDPCPP